MSVTAIVTTLLPIVDRVLDMIPNAEAREAAKRELQLEILKIQAEQNKAQVELNKSEAQHASIFVAGWRPFIGWVGGVSLAWTFLVHPLITWVATVVGYTGTFPALDTEPLMTLVLAMLGIGAMRTVDKIKGVDTKAVGAPKQPTYNE